MTSKLFALMGAIRRNTGRQTVIQGSDAGKARPPAFRQHPRSPVAMKEFMKNSCPVFALGGFLVMK